MLFLGQTSVISTLDSALAETSDLSITHFYAKYLRQHADEAHYVTVSRVLMFFWGAVFFAVSLFFARYSGEGLLDLTFKLPNYVYGAIFGSIVLARLGIGRLGTVVTGAIVATLCVLWMSQHGIAFFYWCPVAGTLMVALVWALDKRWPQEVPRAV